MFLTKESAHWVYSLLDMSWNLEVSDHWLHSLLNMSWSLWRVATLGIFSIEVLPKAHGELTWNIYCSYFSLGKVAIADSLFSMSSELGGWQLSILFIKEDGYGVNWLSNMSLKLRESGHSGYCLSNMPWKLKESVHWVYSFLICSDFL
jgi:hypothetical protein